MKQQVNFYTKEFKPKKDLLSLGNMLAIWLLGIVLTLVIYSVEIEKTAIIKKSWLKVQETEQHQKKQLASLQAGFASRGNAVVLGKTKQDLQVRLQLRNFVLEQLELRVEGMQKGVAGLMESLAKITFDDIWLTEIQVNHGQLSISGMTTDVDKVPQLIQQLQAIKSLQDKRFSRLEIKTHDEHGGILQFTLQSENQTRNRSSGQ
ncbi:MAG: PilN domain-containing protein [Gammaproteobacteria bacterium]|nr:PilN domain-containing protein [Gammaproteobacteria bacterium]